MQFTMPVVGSLLGSSVQTIGIQYVRTSGVPRHSVNPRLSRLPLAFLKSASGWHAPFGGGGAAYPVSTVISCLIIQPPSSHHYHTKYYVERPPPPPTTRAISSNSSYSTHFSLVVGGPNHQSRAFAPTLNSCARAPECIHDDNTCGQTVHWCRKISLQGGR